MEMWDTDEDESIGNGFDDFLNSYRARYVSSLPMTHNFHWEGVHVYLAHGAPWSDTTHVFPNTSMDTCSKIFDVTKADIVVLGHTHIPMKLRFHDKWILNPGALCGNRDDLRHTCGILELPETEFEIFDIVTGKSVWLETVTIFESDND